MACMVEKELRRFLVKTWKRIN